MRRIARTLTSLLLGIMMVIAAAAMAQNVTFIPGTEDLPLMPGLTILAEEGLVFDNPAGRIVEATAEGSASVSSVQQFYAETLPQLGWDRLDRAEFTRGDERLRLQFEAGPRGKIVVRFLIEPR